MSTVFIRIIQVILAVVIVVLAFLLYRSITEPYEAIARQEELTERTRDRMENIRTALTRFHELNRAFPHTLDSLVTFVKTDSLLVARQDSFFTTPFYPDSLPYLPRDPGRTFQYEVNDTSRVSIYLLQDPDTEDQIGALTPDITMVHAASWE